MEPVTEVRGPGAFGGLYESEYGLLVAFGFALCGSWTAAEDLAQDAFLALYRDWDRLGAYSSPEAWLRRAIANRATSRWRRTASEARALARLGNRREPAPATPETAPEVDGEFWAAVRRLPRRQAQVVALHYLEDRSLDDIATVLELAPSTVRVHLHRARAALAAALELEVGDDG